MPAAHQSDGARAPVEGHCRRDLACGTCRRTTQGGLNSCDGVLNTARGGRRRGRRSAADDRQGESSLQLVAGRRACAGCNDPNPRPPRSPKTIRLTTPSFTRHSFRRVRLIAQATAVAARPAFVVDARCRRCKHSTCTRGGRKTSRFADVELIVDTHVSASVRVLLAVARAADAQLASTRHPARRQRDRSAITAVHDDAGDRSCRRRCYVGLADWSTVWERRRRLSLPAMIPWKLFAVRTRRSPSPAAAWETISHFRKTKVFEPSFAPPRAVIDLYGLPISAARAASDAPNNAERCAEPTSFAKAHGPDAAAEVATPARSRIRQRQRRPGHRATIA